MEYFDYLGSMITSEKHTHGIMSRIVTEEGAFNKKGIFLKAKWT
jgi:hypothetical protein